MAPLRESEYKGSHMNRPNHFEIYTADPVAVQPFYKDVFGWKFQKFEGGPIEYWLVTSGDDQYGRGRIAGSNDQEDRTTWRQDLRAEDGDPESRLARLCRRSSRQCV